MPFFPTADGTRLCYRVTGDGAPAMLLVHGWCSSSRHWKPQADHFASTHRVINYDRRGHGRSDAPAARYTTTQHVRDLAELVAHLKLEELVLVAHAGGGPTALTFAARNPDAVRAVVLMEGNLNTPQEQRERTAPLMLALQGATHAEVFAQVYARFLHPANDPRLIARTVREAGATPVHVIRAELEGLVVDTQQMAREVTQPVLWISAVPKPGQTDSAGVARCFSNAKFGQVVGAAHFPQLEVPDQVNAMLERFLRQTFPRVARRG